MCDIFPTFENCCGCINLKVGIMMIAMLAIVTGSIMMSLTEKMTKASINEMISIGKIKSPKQALNSMEQLIRSGLVAMSVLFMAMGVILLLAVLGSQEGFIQVFVWVTFANVIFGLIMVIAIFYECAFKDTCLLSGTDCLTGASAMVFATFYLCSWIYFISVANSLVVLVFSP